MTDENNASKKKLGKRVLGAAAVLAIAGTMYAGNTFGMKDSIGDLVNTTKEYVTDIVVRDPSERMDSLVEYVSEKGLSGYEGQVIDGMSVINELLPNGDKYAVLEQLANQNPEVNQQMLLRSLYDSQSDEFQNQFLKDIVEEKGQKLYDQTVEQTKSIGEDIRNVWDSFVETIRNYNN